MLRGFADRAKASLGGRAAGGGRPAAFVFEPQEVRELNGMNHSYHHIIRTADAPVDSPRKDTGSCPS